MFGLDRNSLVHFGFIAATAVACVTWGWWALLVYPLLHVVSDVLYYKFQVSVFDPTITIWRGYEVSLAFNDAPHSMGIDYGFNLYDGDTTKDPARAQRDKFDHAYRLLGLAPGMRVIDIGCGCGDWLTYLAGRGVEGTGVNITRAQVDVCHERGLDAHWIDWKEIPGNADLRQRLYGKFDRVTFWDTVEHYVPMKYRLNHEAKDEIYTSMFEFARALLRDDTGRIFISCLHMRTNLSRSRLSWSLLGKLWYAYILDKFHSGNYPDSGRDCLVKNAQPLFELAHREDRTRDYYLTSVLEPAHFGRHKFRWTPRRVWIGLTLPLVDPFWFHRLIWFATENWMFQFDDGDVDRSDVVLYWMMFRARG